MHLLVTIWDVFWDYCMHSLFIQYFTSGANFGPDIASMVSGSFVSMDYCPYEDPGSVSYVAIEVLNFAMLCILV